MVKHWISGCVVFLWFLNILAFPTAVAAQGVNPPQPYWQIAPDLPDGVQRDPQGRTWVADPERARAVGIWGAELDRDENTNPWYVLGPGEDRFGYKRLSTSYQWVDASAGIILPIHQVEDRVKADLPFRFPFYQYSYSSLSINGGGYLDFMASTEGFSSQQYMPLNGSAESVIAPYWAYLTYANSAIVSRVFMDQGTWQVGEDAGQHYVVVQWSQVQDARQANIYDFEVVLFESGSILFQYRQMTQNGPFDCAVAGIENEDGKLGINTLRFCDWQPAGTVWKIQWPAPSARVMFTETETGGLGGAGQRVRVPVHLRNLGDLGNGESIFEIDTFSISVISQWKTRFLKEDGNTPLSDTNFDGKIDSGPVRADQEMAFIVEVQVPKGAKVGQSVVATVLARSTLDPKKSAKVKVRISVPTRFGQAYGGFDEGVFLADPGKTLNQHYDYRMVPENLLQLDDGSFIQYGSNFLFSCFCTQLRITTLDQDGEMMAPPIVLVDHSSDEQLKDDTPYAMAVNDNEIAAILFNRYIWDPTLNKIRYNLFLGLTPLPGQPEKWTEINLTQDEQWYDSESDPMIPAYFSMGVAAVDQNRFVVVWDVYDPYVGPTGVIHTFDIWGAVIDSDGNWVAAPRELAAAEEGVWNDYLSPGIAALKDGGAAILWSQAGSGSQKMYVSLWESDLTMRAEAQPIGEGYGSDDIVQLSNGRLLAAWNTMGPYLNVSAKSIVYGLIDPITAERIGEVHYLRSAIFENLDGIPEVTSDSQDRGVVTWGGMDRYHPALAYALISGKTGKIITPPTPFLLGLSNFIRSAFHVGLTTYH